MSWAAAFSANAPTWTTNRPSFLAGSVSAVFSAGLPSSNAWARLASTAVAAGLGSGSGLVAATAGLGAASAGLLSARVAEEAGLAAVGGPSRPASAGVSVTISDDDAGGAS